MAKNNVRLNTAKKEKNDEFYTRLEDIEREIYYYQNLFEGKTVLCNCDDPYESKFFEYFVLHFNTLKLKKLICTCYARSPIAWNQLTLFDAGEDENPMTKTPYKAVVTQVYDKTGNGYLTMEDIKALFKSKENRLTKLKEDGDFRSPECIELLKEADIVVTNPPFSLFREYVAQLMEYGKKFLIVGHNNAITYKEIFPYIKAGKIWLGNGFPGDVGHFYSHYTDIATASDHKEGCIRVSGVNWFTNMDFKQRHEELRLFMNYTPEAYPKYDNYDAIEVSKSKNIPCDYDGVMGVPITFLEKHCPEQFELLWLASGHSKTSMPSDVREIVGFKPEVKSNAGTTGYGIVNGHQEYHRILIRKKK